MATRPEKRKAAELWIVLARCYRAVNVLVERSIAGLGLCLSDFMVLEALLHKGPLTISDIQAKVLLASGSMTAAVDRLEKKSLLTRKTTASDRRARMLQLTPEGRLLVERAFMQHARDLERVMSVLNTDEKELMYGPLKKLGLSAAEALQEKSAVQENRFAGDKK